MEQRRVVAGLAGIAAFALAWSGSKAFFSQRHVASPEVLARVAAEMNKTLPMMVDEDTELSSTIGVSGVLVYNYRLVNHSASDIDPAQFTAAIKPQVTNAACSTPETRDGFLKKGVSLRYMYGDKERTHVATIDVAPRDCGL